MKKALLLGAVWCAASAPAFAGKRQKPGALRRELDCLLAEASVQHRGPDLEHTVCASG